ncbi:MAG TPA: hypothetical protein VH969_22835 [Actinophytocola sp.]|uniref:hypothetical protein n=1 Tax=Actinophytocola sp. TaxID=1872138 RepID=UPI002F94755E
MRAQEAGRRAVAVRRRLMFAGFAAALALVTAGCSNDVAGEPRGVNIGPLTTAEATSQALTDFAEAAAVRYTGSLVAADGAELTVDLTATLTGEVSGGITIDALPATVLYVGKTLYLKANTNFWSGMVARFGVTSGDGSALANRWVKLPTSLIGVEFGEIFTPDVVAQTAGKVTKQTADLGLRHNAEESIAGVDAYAIEVDGGTVYFATTQPHGVLRFDLDKLGSGENTAVTSALLDVTDVSPNVVAIYQSLNKAAAGLGTAVDALTGIQQGAHRFDKCGAPSCTLIVDIKNTAKSAVRVHLRANWTGDGTKLGGCESKIGPVAPGASSKISCRITSAQWKSFYQKANSVPGTHPYGAQWSALVLAEPPDVADLKTWAAAKPAAADDHKTDGTHAVYEISASGTPWKYGVVPNRYWRDHANDQRRACMADSRSACTVSRVTVADDPVSAHALATKLIADYVSEHDGCPAGQWVSCTK